MLQARPIELTWQEMEVAVETKEIRREVEIKTEAPAETKRLPSSPLSLQLKQRIVEELKKIDHAHLKPALIDAALNGKSFPKPINHKLANLQIVYQEHQKNASVASHIKSAIVDYIDAEMFKEIVEFFKQSFKEEDWNSDFLNFVGNYLRIKIEEEPLVEAAIKDGKIYWRVVQGQAVIFERHKSFDFAKHTTWHMTWGLFRVFKDSGKRSSSVAITQELFISSAQSFGIDQYRASQVWVELKNSGVLNSRNRLSHGWRSLSNKNFKLTTLPGEDYSKVLSAIYAIANDPKHQEIFKCIPGAVIYRPERAKKQWCKTGLIRNHNGKNEEYRMKIWDVAIYSDAKAHHDSNAKTSLGDVFHKDHIPSTCFLNEVFKETQQYKAFKKYEDDVNVNKQTLKVLDDRYTAEFLAYKQNYYMAMTRERCDSLYYEMNTKFLNETQGYREIIARLESEKNKIVIEDEDMWWTITLPGKFHKQGETFAETKKEQENAKEPPFLREVKDHLDKLEKRGKDFFPNDEEESLKALGAFRYLYRTQVKDQPNVLGQYSLGKVSQLTLFNNPSLRNVIDQFFAERIKRFLDRREGLVLSPDKDGIPVVRKALTFKG